MVRFACASYEYICVWAMERALSSQHVHFCALGKNRLPASTVHCPRKVTIAEPPSYEGRVGSKRLTWVLLVCHPVTHNWLTLHTSGKSCYWLGCPRCTADLTVHCMFIGAGFRKVLVSRFSSLGHILKPPSHHAGFENILFAGPNFETEGAIGGQTKKLDYIYIEMKAKTSCSHDNKHGLL